MIDPIAYNADMAILFDTLAGAAKAQLDLTDAVARARPQMGLEESVEALSLVHWLLLENRSLSSALRQTGYFEAMTVALVGVYEAEPKFEEGLYGISALYEQEAEQQQTELELFILDILEDE